VLTWMLIFIRMCADLHQDNIWKYWEEKSVISDISDPCGMWHYVTVLSLNIRSQMPSDASSHPRTDNAQWCPITSQNW
jgi:hypothetical protein